ncbi:MAG TPA: methyltransferase domain-containing protein [Verrucomicrobiae bacterium]|nr:methyltransferase domain-containing protein [Verrucomicrobiae bacterium]
MMKLNVGCGDRFAKGWLNVDFHPVSKSVKRVNLLAGLPFSDNNFDVVYSSHVLEHFSRDAAEGLAREMHRVLKPNGIIRVVVPDLEQTCREYLRILEQATTSANARSQYEWIMLELLDQLTRVHPSGLMAAFFERLSKSNNEEMIAYVQSRTENTPLIFVRPKTRAERVRDLSLPKMLTKLVYVYIALVKRLFPGRLRDAIVDASRVGEKHRWMYDRFGMTLLLQSVGFRDITFLSANESAIPDFVTDHLDTLPDGRPYKNVSLYAEARKSASMLCDP